MSTTKKHWLKPLSGTVRPGRHVLLWIETDESKPVLKRISTAAWDVIAQGERIQAWHLGGWVDTAGLEHILDAASKGRGTLTIWLARGWEDLVLSGLAELLDCNACTWRYAMMDGQKLLIRGLWHSKSVVITSLANWTGSRWDRWPQALEDETVARVLPVFAGGPGADYPLPQGLHLRYLCTWIAIARASSDLGCVSVAPSVAGGAMQIWRRWLAPRIKTMIERPCGKRREAKLCPTVIVCPSPFRPDKAAEAERHSAYGLMTRQLRRGLVDESIYCVDLRSAYLLALTSMAIPLQYRRTLYRPSASALADSLADSCTGHALVRIQTNRPYPVRVAGRVMPATGHYWTWLAGAELGYALCTECVREVHTAYIWDASYLAPNDVERILAISSVYAHNRSPALVSAWRALYSALVGQFASRRKRWEDCPQREGIARWAQWESSDCRTNTIQQYRCIAGHTQRLVERVDTSAAIPLLYACVTAQVRSIMMTLTDLSGVANTICIHADSLWVTQAGWQSLQRRISETGHAPDSLRTKAIYDRVWMSGKSLLVTERKGVRVLSAPGLGDGAVLDEQLRCQGQRAVPWGRCESIDAASGCKRRKVIFAGQRVLDKYSDPAVALPLGEAVDDVLMAESLLLPLRAERRKCYD